MECLFAACDHYTVGQVVLLKVESHVFGLVEIKTIFDFSGLYVAYPVSTFFRAQGSYDLS